jgi:hypothetical protein
LTGWRATIRELVETARRNAEIAQPTYDARNSAKLSPKAVSTSAITRGGRTHPFVNTTYRWKIRERIDKLREIHA